MCPRLITVCACTDSCSTTLSLAASACIRAGGDANGVGASLGVDRSAALDRGFRPCKHSLRLAGLAAHVLKSGTEPSVSSHLLAGTASGSILRPADARSASPALRDPSGLRPLQNNPAARDWFKDGQGLTQAANQILLAPPQNPPWEQDPLADLVPRAKRELKSEVSKIYQNSVDIMGFLGSDAETKNARDGVPVTVLSLATKRSWKDAQGDWQSHTD